MFYFMPVMLNRLREKKLVRYFRHYCSFSVIDRLYWLITIKLFEFEMSAYSMHTCIVRHVRPPAMASFYNGRRYEKTEP